MKLSSDGDKEETLIVSLVSKLKEDILDSLGHTLVNDLYKSKTPEEVVPYERFRLRLQVEFETD